MERTIPHREADGKPHAAVSLSPTVAGHGSDNDQYPFGPVVDAPGTPIRCVRPIAPAMIARAANDRGMIEALQDEDALLAKAGTELVGEILFVIGLLTLTPFAVLAVMQVLA